MSPVARIDRDQRRLQLRITEAPQAVGHGALGHVLQLRDECRLHVPVGRMVAAEAIAEQLTQIILRVAGLRLHRAGIRPHADPRPARRLLLRRR